MVLAVKKIQTCLPVQETKETWVQFLGQEDPLEEGMATHSSILDWRISRTERPGGYSLWGRKESDTTEQPTLFISNLVVPEGLKNDQCLDFSRNMKTGSLGLRPDC